MTAPPRTPLPLLPLHLTLSQASLLSLRSALAFANSGSPNSNSNFFSGQNSAFSGRIAEAVLGEALKREEAALQGIQSYLQNDFPAARMQPPPDIWQKGSARLLSFEAFRPVGAAEEASVLLLIPSLINRYYILDFTEKRSLARHLAARGHHVYLLDWGAPGETEQAYGIEAYLEALLLPAIRFLNARHGRPIIPVGYCMGGLFALTLSQLYPALVERLVLLATPWDFHAPDARSVRLPPAIVAKAAEWIDSEPYISGEIVQCLFHLHDPWRFQEKFIYYHRLRAPGARRYFVQIERWASDSVPLTRRVARESLIDWLQHNSTAHGQWRIAGTRIQPAAVPHPTLVVAAQHDRIVSLQSATILASLLPNSRLQKPLSGHIGMITGANRKKHLWNPLCAWLEETA